jgi:hypothetical protein
MGLVADRIKTKITDCGETLAFTKLAGVVAPANVKAFVTPMNAGEFETYFDATEIALLTYPVLRCIAAGDSTVIVADLFPRDGVNYIVDTVFLYRYEAVGAAKLFLAVQA